MMWVVKNTNLKNGPRDFDLECIKCMNSILFF